LPDGAITSVAIDADGNKWIGVYDYTTEGGGLVKFDGTNWTVHDKTNSGIPGNYVSDIAADRDGNVWAVASDGWLLMGQLVKFDGADWTVYDRTNSGVPGDYVSGVAADPSGNVWAGVWQYWDGTQMVGGGLVKFDGANWTVYDAGNSGLPSNQVQFLTIGKDGNTWMMSAEAVVRYDGTGWTVRNIMGCSGLPNRRIQSLAVDQDGGLWVATWGGLGYLSAGFRTGDGDGDCVVDSSDNCPVVYNPDQLDTDGDGEGNACDPDDDNDGRADSVDNCPFVANPGQENTDAAIDNGPGIPGDDTTIPNAVADSEGDACETDGDIDNDGLSDAQDTNPLGAGICAAFAGASDGHPHPAGGDVTNDDDHDGDPAPPMGGDASDNGPSWDTDNDGALDGVECALGHNPRDHTNRPSTADCGGTGDTDGDGLQNAWETCGWGTSPTAVDTDGDGKGDCKEAADVDGNGFVGFVGDTIYYAKAALLPRASFGKTMDFDIDRNGAVDLVGDVIQEAKFALIPGLCK
jgi:hypothetical protein